MFEMWFDGGNIVPINDLIDRLSPGIISFQGRRTGGSRWVGTEHGFAPYPCWNTIDWKEGETPKEGAGTPTGNLWCPAECDVSIMRPRWFWSKAATARILSLDALVEIYYLSVGRGVNLLLNATPDSHGEVPAAQMKRLQEFGDEIRERFAKPLAHHPGRRKPPVPRSGRREDHRPHRPARRHPRRRTRAEVRRRRPACQRQMAGARARHAGGQPPDHPHSGDGRDWPFA